MSLLLPEMAMRGTESQDRVVAIPTNRRTLLRRYGAMVGAAAALLLLVVWSARAWLSSEKVIPRDRVRTAVVERGPFVRDVAATGTVVAAVSPTLFAEAPGTIIYKVRAGDTVKEGDVLGKVESAALTNEYERERATLTSTEAALNRQTIEVRRTILKSSQDTDLAKVQITAAERAQVVENAPLVTVVDLTALEIEFQVSESYANEIRSGMNAQIALDGRQFNGTVAGISPDVRNAQVTGRVRFVEQPKGLRQNQRASVRIVLDERDDVLKVARSPFSDSDSKFAYVVRDDAAVRTPVEFGAAAIGEIEIRNGLNVGDTVVLSDMRDYKDAPSVLIGN
jgi:hypothetical protein